MKKISLLGTGLIGNFYVQALHGQRNRDKIVNVYSRTKARVREFAEEWNIPNWTTDMDAAIDNADSDAVSYCPAQLSA